MDLFIRFLILVLLGLVLGGSAQVTSLSADDLLNRLEASLLELVSQVQANALNSCELLSTCNEESTCSQLTCPLTSANTAGYECQEVLQNTYCKDNCPWRNFDFSRSVLSVPGVKAVTEEYITPRQLLGICAQRNLDTFFQNHSNNTNFFSLYFGSVDGTFRFFPGMYESDCGRYDPRVRVWYLTSTTMVKKAVMGLIDSGSSMTEIFPSTSNDSRLATAFRITDSFLNTTTKDDYVNIFTFDQDKVEPFSAQPVKVTNAFSHPDFENFTAMLSTPNQSSVPPRHIADAISNVITSSAGFNISSISSEYLKVIILITESGAVDAISNAALPWDLIKNNNINVFLYMFPPSTVAINASPLASQLCTTRGYFEILDNTTIFENPLLALEAYYSFLANVHSTYVNAGIDYSIEYSDSSDVDNQTFTLSKAAFSSNGELLGIAAIDIFKNKMLKVYGIDGDALKIAITSIINTVSFNASAGINTSTCLNHASNKTCNQTASLSNIVCSSNFNTDISTLRKLSCCGTCTGADKPRNWRLAIGLGLGLGIPALILGVAFIVRLCKRGGRQPDVHAVPVFPGKSGESGESGQSGEDEDLR